MFLTGSRLQGHKYSTRWDTKTHQSKTNLSIKHLQWNARSVYADTLMCQPHACTNHKPMQWKVHSHWAGLELLTSKHQAYFNLQTHLRLLHKPFMNLSAPTLTVQYLSFMTQIPECYWLPFSKHSSTDNVVTILDMLHELSQGNSTFLFLITNNGIGWQTMRLQTPLFKSRKLKHRILKISPCANWSEVVAENNSLSINLSMKKGLP